MESPNAKLALPLNAFQQVFGLSLLSNAVNECEATSETLRQKLVQALNINIPERVGSGWEVVWGPVVWKPEKNRDDPKTSPGNSWFVARHESLVFEDNRPYCTYVVAVAGTAGNYDWIREDLGVIGAVNLDAWAGPEGPGIKSRPHWVLNSPKVAQSNQAFISNGFAQAVFTLLNTAPPDSSPGGSQNLPDFLDAIPFPSPSRNPLRLVFTGHSLGGALSPSLAYTLHKAKALGKFVPGDMRVYPTAGPTPGNKSFANKFQAAFPPPVGSDLSGYQHWNCNIVNKFDIVPQGYCNVPNPSGLQLRNIPNLYGQSTSMAHLIRVKAGISTLKLFVGKTYYPLPISHFEGCDFPPKVPENEASFMKVAYFQHVEAYTLFILGIKRPDGVCKKIKKEEMQGHPVLHHLSRTREMMKEDGVVEWDGEDWESEDRDGTTKLE